MQLPSTVKLGGIQLVRNWDLRKILALWLFVYLSTGSQHQKFLNYIRARRPVRERHNQAVIAVLFNTYYFNFNMHAINSTPPRAKYNCLILHTLIGKIGNAL